jgi:hypothetical protein
MSTDASDRRQQFSKERQAAHAALEEIWAKTKDEDPKDVERIVDEEVREVRQS